MVHDIDGEWTLGDAMDAFRDAVHDELHTALVARVERYWTNPETLPDGRVRPGQIADVTPMVKRALERDDSSYSTGEAFPTLRAVPVVYPRGGGWFAHWPLTAGDFVLVIVCERDLQEWLQTGQLSRPLDFRLHHLANAVAIAGLFPSAQRLDGLPDDALQIGRAGGPLLTLRPDGSIEVAGDQELARAGNLDVHLDAIAQGLDALMTAVSGGTPTPQPNYGVTAKTALDASNPIPTENTKGS